MGNLPQLKKHMNLQIKCTGLVLRKENENKSTQRHRIMKLQNINMYFLKNKTEK